MIAHAIAPSRFRPEPRLYIPKTELNVRGTPEAVEKVAVPPLSVRSPLWLETTNRSPAVTPPLIAQATVGALAVAVHPLMYVMVGAVDAGVTVRIVEALIAPEVAEIVVVPVPAPVAKPVLFMAATDVLLEPQVTEPVRSCVLLSL